MTKMEYKSNVPSIVKTKEELAIKLSIDIGE